MQLIKERECALVMFGAMNKNQDNRNPKQKDHSGSFAVFKLSCSALNYMCHNANKWLTISILLIVI